MMIAEYDTDTSATEWTTSPNPMIYTNCAHSEAPRSSSAESPADDHQKQLESWKCKMAALGDNEMLDVPLSPPPKARTTTARSRPLIFIKAIIGECLCEPFPPASNGDASLASNLMMKMRGALSFSSPQFIELHGIQFIGLGALEDELTARERVYDTLEQLTTRTDRLISVGCLLETTNPTLAGTDAATAAAPQSSTPLSRETSNNVTVTTQSIPYDVWNATYPNDVSTSRAVKRTIANIQGQNFKAALADFRRAYRQQKRDPSRNGNSFMLGITIHNMAVVSVLAGHDDEALPLFEEAVAVKSDTFGPQHPEVATSLDELGIQLFAVERYEDALAAFSQSHRILSHVHGPGHPHLSMVLNNMACCAFQMRDMEAALSTMSRAMELQQKATTLSSDAANGGGVVASSANNADMELLHMAILLNNSGYLKVCVKEYDDARACFDEALLIQQSVLGDAHNHRAIRDSRSNLEFTNVFHSEG
jgi:Tfp pilus assembly protein PilF